MTHFLRKRLWLILSISVLFLSLFLFDRYRRRKEVYDRLLMEFNSSEVEYGSKLKAEDLIKEHTGDLVSNSELDTFTLGEQTLTYTLNQEESFYHQQVRRTYELTVNIADRNKPLIELDKDKVYVYKGKQYDPKDNVLRVYDVVDGDISDYQITSNADLENTGEYDVVITATDKNGLTNTASYKLVVREVALSASEGYDVIYNMLTTTYGYNRAAACGILANIRFESNFNPDVGDYYYGLCQWGGSRKDNLYAFCANNGYDAASIEGQLAYLDHELSSGYAGVKTYLQGIENSSAGAFEAGDYFCKHFEGAASADGRGELAAAYFDN